MFSRKAKIKKRPVGSHFSNWSISRRLTTLYAGSSLLLLVLAAAYLYWSLLEDLRQDDAAFLGNEIQECRALLRERPEDTSLLTHEIESEAAGSQFIKYYVRLVDERRQVLRETPGMADLLPPENFPAPVGPEETPSRGKIGKPHTGRSYLMMSAATGTGPGTRGARIVQVALDITADEVLIAGYRWKLLGVVVLGLMFSCASSVLVAKRGLRPLKEITEATERVTASQLHERIPAEGWPEELAVLAASFDRMLDRLEDSFMRLSEFSADLAHELRTPINNLRGEAGVAISQPRTVEEYRRTLESSLEEYARLGRLIDNLLFLARADGQMRIAPESCDGRKAAQVVVDFYEALAADRGVHLTCEGTGIVVADPILLRQAISNLVANALNYTARGGKVTVSVQQNNGCGGELSVMDTGSGIPAMHLSRIFDRFYRVDPARSKPSDRTGLGLAIVKSIMTLHQGRVEVESETGKGSRFTLKFRQAVLG